MHPARSAAHQFTIVLAASRDAAQIAELSRDAIEAGLGWSWTPRRVARAIADPSTNVIVAVGAAPTGILGFGIMKYLDDESHLMLLAVSERRRRAGIGTALLFWLETTARVCGVREIRLESRASNEAARCFYDRHGYAEVGMRRGYYSGLEDAICLGKRLRVDAPPSACGPLR